MTEQTTYDFEDGKGPVPAHRHKNPDGSTGGWVANSATVAETAYVGPDALVYGEAKVSNEAKVGDFARVYDFAQVYGNAQIGGNARVCDDTSICGWAKVNGRSRIQGQSSVSGAAYVNGYARLYNEHLHTGTYYGSAEDREKEEESRDMDRLLNEVSELKECAKQLLQLIKESST